MPLEWGCSWNMHPTQGNTVGMKYLLLKYHPSQVLISRTFPLDVLEINSHITALELNTWNKISALKMIISIPWFCLELELFWGTPKGCDPTQKTEKTHTKDLSYAYYRCLVLKFQIIILFFKVKFDPKKNGNLWYFQLNMRLE